MSIEPRLRRSSKTCYEIRLIGRISHRWAGWIGEMTVLDIDEGDQECISTISIEAIDQAALLGILQKLHSLGFSLVEIRLLARDTHDQGRDQ